MSRSFRPTRGLLFLGEPLRRPALELVFPYVDRARKRDTILVCARAQS